MEYETVLFVVRGESISFVILKFLWWVHFLASIRLNATFDNSRAGHALMNVLSGIFNRQTPGPWRA
jgi:hypothetical protein